MKKLLICLSVFIFALSLCGCSVLFNLGYNLTATPEPALPDEPEIEDPIVPDPSPTQTLYIKDIAISFDDQLTFSMQEQLETNGVGSLLLASPTADNIKIPVVYLGPQQLALQSGEDADKIAAQFEALLNGITTEVGVEVTASEITAIALNGAEAYQCNYTYADADASDITHTSRYILFIHNGSIYGLGLETTSQTEMTYFTLFEDILSSLQLLEVADTTGYHSRQFMDLAFSYNSKYLLHETVDSLTLTCNSPGYVINIIMAAEASAEELADIDALLKNKIELLSQDMRFANATELSDINITTINDLPAATRSILYANADEERYYQITAFVIGEKLYYVSVNALAAIKDTYQTEYNMLVSSVITAPADSAATPDAADAANGNPDGASGGDTPDANTNTTP